MRNVSTVWARPAISIHLIAALLLGVLAAMTAGASQAQAQAQKRVALVIGNSTYQHTVPLANPEHDATLIAAALRQRGFEVLEHTNLGFQAMRRAFAAFTTKLQAAGRNSTGLVFYAGHGMQVNGLNYMIPVDARIAKQADVEVEAVSATALMRSIAIIGNKLNIIILDACRNNPYRSMFRSAGRGLARMDAPIGSLVAFSTAPGTVAADGTGRNSPYSKNLALAIAVPGLKLEDVFKRVRNAVYKETSGAQVPWESSSIFGDFFFSKGASAASPTPPPQGQAAQVWAAIQTSQSPAVLRAFITQFPKSIFATFAKARLEELGKKRIALTQPPATAPPEAMRRQPPPMDNRLRAIMANGGAPITGGLRWDIYAAKKSASGKRKHITYATQAQPKLTLKAGRYFVRVSRGNASTTSKIEVRTDKPWGKVFVLNAGRLLPTAALAKDQDVIKKNMRWDVYHAKTDEDGKRKHITYATTWRPKFVLPAGRYFVLLSHGNARISGEVAVTPGKTLQQRFVLNAGRMMLTGGLAKDSPPIKGGMRWDVYHAETDEDDKRKHITYATTWRPKFILATGRYYVTLSYGNAFIGQEVAVAAAKLTKSHLILNAGQVSLTAALTKDSPALKGGLRFDVYHANANADGKRKHVTYGTHWRSNFTLPTGKYLMWVAYGNATASVALAVEPGATTRALLPLNAGRIKLVARAKDGKLLTRPLRWDIYLAKVNFEGKRRHITYNTSRQPILNLNAGRYLIVLASGKSRSQRDLVVTAGDIKPFEVQLK